MTESEQPVASERAGTSPTGPGRTTLENELRWAHWGTAYFARQLNGLTDAQLDDESPSSGVSRRHVVTRVSHQARLMAGIIAAVRTGTAFEVPDAAAREDALLLGATVPAEALRHLFRHSAVHLAVEWRDCADKLGDGVFVSGEGEAVRLRDIPWVRATGVWFGAYELGAETGGVDEFPQDYLLSYVGFRHAELVAAGVLKDVQIEVRGPSVHMTFGEGRESVRGTPGSLAVWLSGYPSKKLNIESNAGLPDIERQPGLLRISNSAVAMLVERAP